MHNSTLDPIQPGSPWRHKRFKYDARVIGRTGLTVSYERGFGTTFHLSVYEFLKAYELKL